MAILSCDNRPDGQPPPLPPREYFTPLRQDYFVPVPILFGQETIEKDILARRAAFYTSAQTFLSHEEWNSYCHFGFHTFEDPAEYIKTCANNSPEEQKLCNWNYYRHLCKHDLEVLTPLHEKINSMKLYIKINHLTLYNLSIDRPVWGYYTSNYVSPMKRQTEQCDIVEEFNPVVNPSIDK